MEDADFDYSDGPAEATHRAVPMLPPSRSSRLFVPNQSHFTASTATLLDQQQQQPKTLLLDDSKDLVDDTWRKIVGAPQPSSSISTWSWWRGESEPTEKTTKDNTPREEQEWEYTKKRVATAVRAILGTSIDVAHEALMLSAELLEFAPVPGLQNVARALLQIWDSAQLMDMNRQRCRRLAERCADTLLSVLQEVHDCGGQVTDELTLPLMKLERAFKDIRLLLQKQLHRSFLKRFLKRDEIMRELSGCDQGLHDALDMFGISVQIRILKQVQASDSRRERENHLILATIRHSAWSQAGLPPSSSHASLRSPGSSVDLGSYSPPMALPPPPTPSSFSQLGSPPHMLPTESTVLPTLQDIRLRQNEHDTADDISDLHQRLRDALAAQTDIEVLNTLGIRHEEMPEALKTLQRTLEKLNDRHICSPTPGVMPMSRSSVDYSVGHGRNRMHNRTQSQHATEGSQSSGRQRSKTISSFRRMSTGSSIMGSPPALTTVQSVSEDRTLELEFVESGIDALRRMSRNTDMNLPSWTITRFEVERDAKIGMGGFSDVFKGTWRGRTVAIKVLAETTPRNLFIREVEIWKRLSHPNVMPFYGASSAVGEPPWFFVSPYAKHGSLSQFLQRVSSERDRANSVPDGRHSRNGSASSGIGLGLGLSESDSRGRVRAGSDTKEGPYTDPRGWDLHKFMREIAEGMLYLHSQDVLHGDLKASNVLVNEGYHCLISDFGQSEMKSEAYRISGAAQPLGTFRWLAPELMLGESMMTPEADVYAFAMCCVEILSMGKVPWAMMDDASVRWAVTSDDGRPAIPRSRFTTPALIQLIDCCWARKWETRPNFAAIISVLGSLKPLALSNGESGSPYMPRLSQSVDWRAQGDNFRERSTLHQHSPQPAPHNSPYAGMALQPVHLSLVPEGSETSSAAPSALDSVATLVPRGIDRLNSQASAASSVLEHPPVSDSARLHQESNDERRYRLMLNHKFHPSLTLPLWTPTKVHLGAVGYLSKPNGNFVTLFNALSPSKSPKGQHPSALPTIIGYGDLKRSTQKMEVRNAAKRGIDALTGMFRKPGDPSRYSHPLRAGHKAAFLYTESTTYKYLDTLDAAKKWFTTHALEILAIYGPEHDIQREDLFLVIGTLNTPDYALFVSHNHPDGEANLVLLPPIYNKPWGVIRTQTECRGGPSYHEPYAGGNVSSTKISRNGDHEATVLLARLRFKPDSAEPTSL
ncbi:hypothetical protein CYLTODRAFT_486241 [Cylindrobasidium torrendii FP15055 ss-10]|uniref:Protein kinase domain-containing protein n=1 Tax=Cylindrobasidium torrendii FP15055 ss-10 TaxID=1314674 RepID=A0A0D7BQS7_9AGAR|nr:hypothetical protein CYLTODRAFT_486241 [Cylindrobasidium torrendii FP15055 ss-10]